MIVLALGSNLSSSYGDRFKNIDLTISHLISYKIKIIKKSSYYETPSYPNNRDPRFINVVVEVSTNLLLKDLVSVIAIIEKKMERIRNKKNEPRTCDIDIIDFNSQIVNLNMDNMKYTIPHKEIEKRNFVLIPLNEILPNWIHPKTKDSIKSLINKLPDLEKKSILKVNKN